MPERSSTKKVKTNTIINEKKLLELEEPVEEKSLDELNHLQVTILGAVLRYLTEDNPSKENTSFWTRVSLWWDGSGAEGRVRAQKYERYLQQNPDITPGHIMADLKNENKSSHLENSQRLRLRVAQALCQFLGINDLSPPSTADAARAIANMGQTFVVHGLRKQLEDTIKLLETTTQIELRLLKSPSKKSSGG